MKPIDRVLFVSQARLGSKRFPGKMLRPFAGSSLVEILCEKIRRSSFIPLEQFWFSAFEDELVDAVERAGVQVFHRSRRSAESEGPIEEILEWHELPFDYAVQVSACNPLLGIDTIDAFARAYVASDLDGLFGVIEKRNYFWDAEGELATPWPGSNFMDTKAVGVTYEAAHCLYAGRLDRLRRGVWMAEAPFRKDAPALFPVPELEAFDIDFEWQFRVAEVLYRQLGAATAPAG